MTQPELKAPPTKRHEPVRDSFFDLGKGLPQVNAETLTEYLEANSEVFECAYTPTSEFKSSIPGDTLPIREKTFKRVRFYETHFKRIVFTRCEFDECLFLGAHFDECEFHQCRFIKCNTHKIRLTRTYLDPRSFIEGMFDQEKYSNVGVDLFHALLKNSIDESQPDFRDTAEYHFRLWQRYNRVYNWKKASGYQRWVDFDFYGYWSWSVLYQRLFGFGVRARNILLWTPILFVIVWSYNHLNWQSFGVPDATYPGVALAQQSAFFTVGTLTTFGSGQIEPTTAAGLAAAACQVVIGIAWIALSTAMIVRRFTR